jgi:chlorite dismutase
MTAPVDTAPPPARPAAGESAPPSASAPNGAELPIPPLTAEGWYASHQVLAFDRATLRQLESEERAHLRAQAASALEVVATPAEGWSAVAPLVGAAGEVMVMHFRPTLDALGDAERRLAAAALFDHARAVHTFLSVTEAGLYQLTNELAAAAAERGGKPGDAAYEAEAEARIAMMREDPHVRRRLYPPLPADMPYVCFYPMSKKRVPEQNWYELPLRERNRMMWAHGLSGRRFAGRVQQIVTGSIGLDVWEWGVTLFARDPLEFKRIVTDMRFDEASARYGEFGSFYVGKVARPESWLQLVLPL